MVAGAEEVLVKGSRVSLGAKEKRWLHNSVDILKSFLNCTLYISVLYGFVFYLYKALAKRIVV